MMNDKNLISDILANGIFAVVRMDDNKKLFKVIDVISSSGIKNIEITMTVPNAIEVIKELIKSGKENIIVGAGTVLSKAEAEKVISAGARFVVSPILDLEIIKMCKDKNIPVVPGCYTPTEILKGWNAGAEIIKIFPAASLGPKYFKNVYAPLPFIKMMPTGGVTIENVGEWVEAGACAVAIGSDLLNNKLIAEENYSKLAERATLCVKNYFEAKDKINLRK
jgi:2-dehydro-3-deoxyphosphogluconate aldolase/(4S)-4-hydroxy-2-oxoglutarate aldolase